MSYRSFSYRNRGQLRVSRPQLLNVMAAVAREERLLYDAGGVCCNTCGLNSLLEGLELPECADLTGVFFFSVQKDDQFEHAEGGEIWLNHCPRRDDRATSRALARRICEALKRHGVSCHWSGDDRECIAVPVSQEVGRADRLHREWRQNLIDQGEDPDEWEEMDRQLRHPLHDDDRDESTMTIDRAHEEEEEPDNHDD